MEKSPIKEGIKEAGRYALITAFFVFITSLIEFIGKSSIQNKDMIVLVLTLVLRGADKFWHEYRKDRAMGTKYVSKSYGILPF